MDTVRLDGCMVALQELFRAPSLSVADLYMAPKEDVENERKKLAKKHGKPAGTSFFNLLKGPLGTGHIWVLWFHFK